MTATALFGIGLFCSLGLVWLYGRERLKGAASVVTIVWLANLGFAILTGDYYNWWFMFRVDFIAAFIILTPPCSTARAFIGILYIGQVIFHGVYAGYELLGLEEPRQSYLSGLYLLGTCQVAALMIGAYHDRGKRLANRGAVRSGDSMPATAVVARDGARR
jgi:hypothetical protein